MQSFSHCIMFGLFSKYYNLFPYCIGLNKYILKDAISEYENTIGIKSNCQYCQSSLETNKAMYVGRA